MMARMAAERVQTGSSVRRLPDLVGSYARRISTAALDQHREASVSSALGVWLLLAACASAAQGSDRAALEEALGCSAQEASRLLTAFIADPPPALKVAVALWARIADTTAELAAWTRGLPDQVESGFMPSQAQADAWADRKTLGLIPRFPIQIDEFTRIVLASALATRVSWKVPFGLVPAADHCGASSPWRGAVSRLLWDGEADGRSMIARTDAAGVVAVHLAVAREDLTVVSVSGAPELDRASVLAAAYAVAATVNGEWGRTACSLYDLPLGAGHSWEISEREVEVFVPEPRLERIAGVALPAWTAREELDLARSPAFGTGPALDALRQLIGPRPNDETQAKQAAVASFTRYGFEAAAITAFGAVAAALRRPQERAIERTAVLRFDHPYAAVAIAGRPAEAGRGATSGSPSPESSLAGLPLFAAWVHQPVEPEDDPPGLITARSPATRADA
jgi:hypothetical protein